MAANLTKEQLLHMYKMMCTVRHAEGKIAVDIKDRATTHIPGPALLSLWMEAIGIGVGMNFGEHDVVGASHRTISALFMRGYTLRDFFLHYFCRKEDMWEGRQGNMHVGDIHRNFLRFISHMGQLGLVVNGVIEARLRRAHEEGWPEPPVGFFFFGDGASGQGSVHSAMLYAAARKLPVVFIVENNQYSISSRPREIYGDIQWLVNRGLGYGMKTRVVDPATDAVRIYEACRELVAHSRRNLEPSYLVLTTLRGHGHNATEDRGYEDKSEHDEWEGRDPLELLRRNLLSRNRMEITAAELDAIEDEVRQGVEQWYQYAINAPEPHATVEDLGAAMPPFSVTSEAAPSSEAKVKRRTFKDAFREGLRLAMHEDPRVVVFGENMAGKKGSVFGMTAGFDEEFNGKGDSRRPDHLSRVWDTILAEDAIYGVAIGMAAEGWTPVADIQFETFDAPADTMRREYLDGWYYDTHQPLRMVMTQPGGYGPSFGEWHSGLRDASYMALRGVVTVMPSRPYDAKGLLLTALLREKVPVIFRQQIWMVMNTAIREEVPEGIYFVPFGKGRIARAGKDLSIITYGPWCLYDIALPVAEELRTKEGLDVEVIDLRTIRPFDRGLILESAKRTRRVVILHEACLTGGPGGELGMSIAEDEECQEKRVRIARLAALDTPVPQSPVLERFRLPSRERLVTLVHRLLDIKS